MALVLVLLLLFLVFGGLGLWVVKWALIIALACLLLAALSGSRRWWP